MEIDDILDKEDLYELDEDDLGIEFQEVREEIIANENELSRITNKIEELESEKEEIELSLPLFLSYKEDILNELKLKCNHLNIENKVCKNCRKTGFPDQMTLF